MNQRNSFSYATQFAMLIGLAGLFMIVTAFVVAIMGSVLLDIPLLEVSKAITQPEFASEARLLNTVASFFAFFIPAVIVTLIVYKKPFHTLGFNSNINMKQVILVICITIAAMLLSGALGELNERIPLPADLYVKAKKMEETYRTAMMAMATMHSFSDYLLAVLVIAVFPAIFEETLFRGCLQQIMVGWTRSKWIGIIITSILFSAIHFSYFGFLPRVGLGIVLGLIYYQSKNIWLNILLHFLNNAFAVTQLYILSRQGKPIEKALDENMPMWWGLIAITLLVFMFRLFGKQSRQLLVRRENKTVITTEANPVA